MHSDDPAGLATAVKLLAAGGCDVEAGTAEVLPGRDDGHGMATILVTPGPAVPIVGLSPPGGGS
jgi:hypothetical protein